MKKVLSLLIALVLLIGSVPSLASEGYRYENGVLYLTGTGEASVIDVDPMQIKKIAVGKDVDNLDYVISAMSKNENSWWVEEIEVNEENPHFSSMDGVLFNKDKTKLIKFPPYKKGEYVIPESVKEIDSRAFERTIKVTSVVINEGVTEIKNGTFSQCMNLESITIPKSVIKIESDAFSGGDTNIVGQHPTALKEIYYNGTYTQWEQIEKGESYNYHRMNITAGGDILKRATKHFTDTYVVIDGKRIEITQPIYANYDRVMVPLKDILIAMGYSVEWDSATWEVRAIKDDTHILFPIFPDNNYKGEVYDVYYADGSGESVVTQNSYQLQSLQGGLYYEDVYHHSVLANGKAMASVKLIEKVFGNSVEFGTTEGVTQRIVEYHYSVNYDNTLTIKGIAKEYDNEENLIIPAAIDGKDVKTIGFLAINMIYVEKIYVSEGIEIIEDDAFYVNSNLKELYIPSTVHTMGSIMGCNKLEKIVVDKNNPYFTIGEDGWLYNKDRTELYWCPPSVKGDVVIPGSVKVIKAKAFWHCWELGKVVIGKNVEKIEAEAFGWQKNDTLEVIFYNPNTEIIPKFSEYNTHAPGWNREQRGSFSEIKTAYGYIGSTAEEVFTKKSDVPSDPEDYRAYRTYPEVEFRPIIDIKINGETMEFETVSYIKNNRTMVPMRAIFEALGATVSWDNNTRTAIGVKDGIEVKITIGENALYKNGEAITLDAVAEITNDRTMVPVRAISEAFGAEVTWDNETKTVEIVQK